MLAEDDLVMARTTFETASVRLAHATLGVLPQFAIALREVSNDVTFETLKVRRLTGSSQPGAVLSLSR